MKQRIWELDALRGIAVLGMVAVHFVYDLVELFGIVHWEYPTAFLLVQRWGGVIFLLISGICVTLGSRSARRGVIVFCCGLIVSAVTVGMYSLHMADRSIIIYFGVLHCLGTCMILWPLFKKLPWYALGLMGAALAAAGLYIRNLGPIGTDLLVPLGFVGKDFASSDYFPLLPNLGFFLLGAFLGKTLYRNKQSLFPNVREECLPLRFLRLCGRQSLWIYLLHQPVLSGICYLILLIK